MIEETTIEIPDRFGSKIEQRAFASGWRARSGGRAIRSNPLLPERGIAWVAWRAGWRAAGALEELKVLRLKDEKARRSWERRQQRKRGDTSTKGSGS